MIFQLGGLHPSPKFIWFSDGAFGFSVRARIARIKTEQEVEKVLVFAKNGPSHECSKVDEGQEVDKHCIRDNVPDSGSSFTGPKLIVNLQF